MAEHCLAGTGALGLTIREMITLSRLFTIGRRINLGWLVVGSRSEDFVSIQSRPLRGTETQVLQSVSRAAVPDERMRIPRDYQRMEPGKAKSEAARPAAAAPPAVKPEAGMPATPASEAEQPAAEKPASQ